MTTREFFVQAYEGEPPPWDIGKPQRDLVTTFDELQLSGSALDLGCGTGELVLELARHGVDAWGIDSTPFAIAAAEKKRDARGLEATFVVGDALDLAPLGHTFNTVLDCGLFHVISEEDRARYLKELPKVLPVGGRFLMMGFQTSDMERGPRGYSPDELRRYLADSWREEFILPGKFETTLPGREFVPAWLSLFVRTA